MPERVICVDEKVTLHVDENRCPSSSRFFFVCGSPEHCTKKNHADRGGSKDFRGQDEGSNVASVLN